MNWEEQYLLTALRINTVYRSNHDVPRDRKSVV